MGEQQDGTMHAMVQAIALGVKEAMEPVAKGVADLLRLEHAKQERMAALETSLRFGPPGSIPAAGPTPEPVRPVHQMRWNRMSEGDGGVAIARATLPNGDGTLIYMPGGEGRLPKIKVERPGGRHVEYFPAPGEESGT